MTAVSWEQCEEDADDDAKLALHREFAVCNFATPRHQVKALVEALHAERKLVKELQRKFDAL